MPTTPNPPCVQFGAKDSHTMERLIIRFILAQGLQSKVQECDFIALIESRVAVACRYSTPAPYLRCLPSRVRWFAGADKKSRHRYETEMTWSLCVPLATDLKVCRRQCVSVAVRVRMTSSVMLRHLCMSHGTKRTRPRKESFRRATSASGVSMSGGLIWIAKIKLSWLQQ